MAPPEILDPLSPDEIAALRRVIADAEHADWLRRKIFFIAPIVFAVVTGVISAVNWVVAHFSWKS